MCAWYLSVKMIWLKTVISSCLFKPDYTVPHWLWQGTVLAKHTLTHASLGGMTWFFLLLFPPPCKRCKTSTRLFWCAFSVWWDVWLSSEAVSIAHGILKPGSSRANDLQNQLASRISKVDPGCSLTHMTSWARSIIETHLTAFELMHLLVNSLLE